jgi:mono/diheme cytochrome c family protein
MRRVIWLVVVAIVLGVGVALLRGIGFTSRLKSSSVEETTMMALRRWATPVELRSATNPVAPSSDALKESMAHWADHCASCHANDGSGGTPIGSSLYPPVPDMRKARTQDLSDGELFYVIERGVPFTGMPAWGNGTPEGERQSWQLVRFIRHLPQLTAGEIGQMEKLNPKSPAQEKRDRAIQDFLSGKSQIIK